MTGKKTENVPRISKELFFAVCREVGTPVDEEKVSAYLERYREARDRLYHRIPEHIDKGTARVEWLDREIVKEGFLDPRKFRRP